MKKCQSCGYQVEVLLRCDRCRGPACQRCVKRERWTFTLKSLMSRGGRGMTDRTVEICKPCQAEDVLTKEAPRV